MRAFLLTIPVIAILFLFTVTMTPKKEPATTLSSRKKIHANLSQKLSHMPDDDLQKALSLQLAEESRGSGVVAGKISLAGQPIFVKKIRITDTEMLEKNQFSTANHFNLPLHYYRPKYTGFGVWRELYCCQKATEWVLSNKCVSFPLLYHFRILKKEKRFYHSIDWAENDSPEINSFLNEHQNATHELVLFFEYIPKTLEEWLIEEIKTKTEDEFGNAIQLVLKKLHALASFLRNEGLIHIDPHVQNILVQEDDLFITDFGLAAMNDFDLTPTEKYYILNNIYFTERALTTYLYKELLNYYFFDPKSQKAHRYDGTAASNNTSDFFVKNYKTAEVFIQEMKKKEEDPLRLFPLDETMDNLIKNAPNECPYQDEINDES
ncbi:hypothetical protein FJ366_03565 [Candidatus Dependentiae bacterium]|nr:hypothetical protein [Candidatus Dependentiae bacterium]